jgi:hypothetical protein
MYSGFYRKRPLSANISLLALEWANFTLSVGFVFLRVIKLILAAGLFIGRIDTPFLAPRVGKFGNFELDNYPTIYLKDLLSHEAHRHPYIEQLGVMYLMKLRYRDDFGKRPGSCWRLIFVYALMPWMHQYRIHVRNEAGLLFQSQSSEAGRKGFGFFSQGRRGGPTHDKNDTGDAKSPISSKMADDVPMEGAILDEGLAGRNTSLKRERSVKLEKENHDLRNQLKRLMQNLSNTTEKNSSQGAREASHEGDEAVIESAEIADDEGVESSNEHVEVFAEF